MTPPPLTYYTGHGPSMRPFMTIRRAAALACASLLLLALSCSAIGSRRPTLPGRLDDATFWRLFTELSEPGGTFRSENLVSNERAFPAVLPEVARRASPTCRLHRRRPGAELLVPRRAQAPRRVHRRHPARERCAPPALQGDLRALADEGRVPVAALLATAVEAPRARVQRERTDGRRRDRNRRAATCSRPTSRRCARSSPRSMAGRSATRTSSA